MVRSWSELRKARHSAVCALVLGCVLAPVANARQNSTADAGAQKSSAAKKTGSSKASSSKHRSSAAGATKSSGKTRSVSSGKRSSRKKSARARGQQKIDSERAQAIQEALIREHYLTGEATGTWNQASEDAMRRYQADQGWQSKTVPDSRALIKLGLGPSKDHLLNPQSAMTTVPDAPKAEPASTTPHSDPAATTGPAPNHDPSSPQ